MSILTHTIVEGDYKAEVFDTNMVKIFFQDKLIDNPGPWGDHDGALQWATLIVAKYAVDGHQS